MSVCKGDLVRGDIRLPLYDSDPWASESLVKVGWIEPGEVAVVLEVSIGVKEWVVRVLGPGGACGWVIEKYLRGVDDECTSG